MNRLAFQWREHGRHGAPGARVQHPAIAMESSPAPEATPEGCRAAAPIRILRGVKVSFMQLDKKFLSHDQSYLNHQVEGTWDHWSSWGACSTTCDSTGTWSRSRTHSGNMPCTGSNTETAGCQSEIRIAILIMLPF